MVTTILLATALQTLPIAQPADSLAWDKPDAAIKAEGVTSFQVCLDAQPCVSVDPTQARIQGTESYKWKLPALTVGPHTAAVKACAGQTCSEPASLTFTLVIQPTPVANLRVGGQ